MYLGCVLSDLTEHGADRQSLITFVWISIHRESQAGTLCSAATEILPASRLGYSALFGAGRARDASRGECVRGWNV